MSLVLGPWPSPTARGLCFRSDRPRNDRRKFLNNQEITSHEEDSSSASRQTYLINPDGKIVKFWPTVEDDLGNHSTNVLAAIAAEEK
jgi:peroxiredoxin